MEYKNEICNGCQQAFTDDDDVVVCPVCGTPQHRSCWQEKSDCVNAHLHADGFVWQKSAVEEKENVEEAKNQEPESETKTLPPVLSKLAWEAQNLETALLKDQIIYKDEEFDGVNVTDAAYHIQSEAHRYVKRFRKNKKITWNWGAFFFSPAWFFYRKLYKVGALFLAAVVAINLFSYSYAQGLAIEAEKVYTVINSSLEVTNNYVETYDELSKDTEFMSQYTEFLKNFGVYFLLTTLIPNIVAALMGDFFVKKKMKKDIEYAKRASNDLQMQRSLILSKGGVSMLLFCAVYFANNYLVSILIYFGSMISEFFN